MASVVFLRAANVGKHNRFQPSALVKELAKFDVVNIGAVGTFVVRANASEKALRVALAKKLPIKCDVMISSAREILDLVRDNPLKQERVDKDRQVFLTMMSEAPAKIPKLPIYAPEEKNWEVKIVRVAGACVLSLWRRLKDHSLYPNQVIEKKFGVATTTRNWNTIEKIALILARVD
jgi:uncharacterized protein (DUF1697 family)